MWYMHFLIKNNGAKDGELIKKQVMRKLLKDPEGESLSPSHEHSIKLIQTHRDRDFGIVSLSQTNLFVK
jgi:hypothetical protein